MSTTVHDWIVEIGFDFKKVRNGVQKVEKLLSRLDKVEGRIHNSQIQREKKKTNELKQQNILHSRRIALVKKAYQAKGLGMKSEFTGSMNSARGKDPDKVRAATLRLEEALVKERRLVAEKEAKAAEKKKEAARMGRIEAEAWKENRQRDASGRRASRAAQAAAVFGANTRGVGLRIDDFESGVKNHSILKGEDKASLQKRITTLRKELDAVKDSAGLKKVRDDLVSARNEMGRLVSKTRELNKEVTATKFVTDGFAGSLKNMARSYASIFATVAGGAALYNSAKQLDTIKSTLLASTGNAEAARAEFEYLAGVSKALGTDLQSSAKAYTQFAVASKEAGLSLETTRHIFEASQEAATAFGLSADDASGVVRALTQMLSKGKVTAEELRQQLGDRMAIAVPIMAKALNVSTIELDKMMKKGLLLSNEVLPKFATELRRAAREGGALAAGMNTIQAQENKLRTSWALMVDEMGKSGLNDAIASTLDLITSVMTVLTPVFKAVARVLDSTVSRIKFVVDLAMLLLEPLMRLFDIVSNKMNGLMDKMPDLKLFKETTVKQTPVPGMYPTVPKGSVNNINVNFTSTNADPKGVRTEFEHMMQNQLRGILTPSS